MVRPDTDSVHKVKIKARHNHHCLQSPSTPETVPCSASRSSENVVKKLPARSVGMYQLSEYRPVAGVRAGMRGQGFQKYQVLGDDGDYYQVIRKYE